MKRCPQCKFIYLDTDEVCDLDGTPLVHVTDAEVDAAGDRSVKAKAPKRNLRVLAITAMAALAFGVVLFFVYYISIRARQQAQIQEQNRNESAVTPLPTPQQTLSTAPTPPSSPSLETSSATAERSSASSHPGSQRPTVSSNPVSTGVNEGARTGSVIRLTNGSKIEADEVWRTKEGFWYRRNGLVTLIKANRVKAIEKTPPK